MLRLVDIPPDTASYSEAILYVLVNDKDVTWEQIFQGMASSAIGSLIDHKTVYRSYIVN